MKQIKLFMVMLLSLVGMTATAQQPTLVSSTATPVNETTLEPGAKYLIAAGTTNIYYFNVNGAKVNAPSTAQVFTYTILNCLRRNSDNNYVYVKKNNMSASSSYNYSTMTMDISFNSEDAASIQANSRYIISNGNNTNAASVSSDQSYDWYFYKAAVVNITYRDVTNSEDINTNTVTYVGRVGDQLQWPDIDGYTLSSEATYSVKGDASVTVNYTSNAGTITEAELESGRYFISSNSKKYISSLKSLVSITDEARTFWSVWNVTNNGDGTYTIVNEGNSKVMTPCSDPEQATLDTDEGYLYYDSEKKAYFVGNVTGNSNRYSNLTIEYNTTQKAYTIRSAQSTTGYYMAVDNQWKKAKDESETLLQGDQCVKSIKIAGTFINDDGETETIHSYPYWTFTPVSTDDNSTLYKNGVELLDGYVGGLTTMKIPDDDVEDLKPLRKVINKYNTDKENINAENAATKYKEFVEEINAMRSEDNTDIFVQKLVEGRPFYVETIGDRKAYGNRLYYDNSDEDSSKHHWKNAAIGKFDAQYGTFYVEVIKETATVLDPAKGAEAVNEPVTKNTCYYLKNSESTPRYLARTEATPKYAGKSWADLGKTWEERVANSTYRGNALSNVYIGSTTNSSDPLLLKFIIVPIIPGVYQICDTDPTYAGDPFLTFNAEPSLNHYRVSEVYSYFRFKTYNVYDYEVKQAGTDYVGSYGNILNSKINDTNITAYYIRAGKHSYDENDNISIENATKEQMKVDDKGWGVEWDKNATFTVYLDVVPDRNMQGMQGYILKGEAATQGEAVVNNEKAYDLKNNNMLHVALNEIYIEPDTWGNYYDIFVLAYKPQGTVIGTWHQEPVEAVGLGFYHLKRGQKLPTGRCYLSTADLCTQLKRRYPNDWDNTYFYPYPKTSTGGAAAPASDEGNQNEAGFRIVFRDSNGVQTAIEEAPIIEVDNEAELDAMSQIYSLDGRKVTTPKSGEIYILNGKKVMF